MKYPPRYTNMCTFLLEQAPSLQQNNKITFCDGLFLSVKNIAEISPNSSHLDDASHMVNINCVKHCPHKDCCQWSLWSGSWWNLWWGWVQSVPARFKEFMPCLLLKVFWTKALAKETALGMSYLPERIHWWGYCEQLCWGYRICRRCMVSKT